MLSRSRVLSIVGEFKTGGVAQHMRMDREGEFRPLSGPGYNLAESGISQWTFALGDKYILSVRIIPFDFPERPQFRSGKRMGTGDPVFSAAYVEQSLFEIRLGPAQSHQLRYPQPVTKCNQDHGCIPLAMTSDLAGRCDHFVNFRRRQKFSRPSIFVFGLEWWSRHSYNLQTFPKTTILSTPTEFERNLIKGVSGPV